MASVEELIFARLSGHAGVSAIAGSRIYFRQLPDAPTYPCILYFRVFDEELQPQPTPPAADLIMARFQFDARSPKPAEARDLRNQIRAALQRWSTSGPPIIQDTFRLSGVDLQEPDSLVRNMSSDYRIHYEE